MRYLLMSTCEPERCRPCYQSLFVIIFFVALSVIRSSQHYSLPRHSDVRQGRGEGGGRECVPLTTHANLSHVYPRAADLKRAGAGDHRPRTGLSIRQPYRGMHAGLVMSMSFAWRLLQTWRDVRLACDGRKEMAVRCRNEGINCKP